MGYEPLHHKYRPQTFTDLVGQEAIAHTLANALNTKRIAPAYLFTGARGTGKTSSARIMAKSLNCLSFDHPTPHPCGKCELCHSITNGNALDITEIDAASNTGVDNIRELIERAQFAPVKARFKVYIIDECLTGDTLVQTDLGLMRLDDPSLLGKQVLSYDEQTEKWEYKKVLRWLDRGIKPTLIIKTNQQSIQCTGNHLIRTHLGWIKASNIKAGMSILSPVPVDVEKNWISPISYFKRAKDYKASCHTGSATPTKKIMASGQAELTSILLTPKSYLERNWDSFTEPYWEMPLSVIPMNTADFQDWLGHIATNSKNGWHTKSVGYQSYVPTFGLLKTQDTEANQPLAVPCVIPNSLLFLTLLNQKETSKPYQWSGFGKLLLKVWHGGTWMMERFYSHLKEAQQFIYLQKDTHWQKTKLFNLGCNPLDIQLSYSPTSEKIKSTTTFAWEPTQAESGYLSCGNTASHQWLTNLERVEFVTLVGEERVYDIEVEDNHNFVANGLLVHNCHMLSTAAFNALLKTLEEPPDRVTFILATTDPQRVLPTIISRCQRFDFRRIPLDAMVQHLGKIAKNENININLEAITLVAQISQGGLRDAESLLDQLSLVDGEINVGAVWDLVGSVPEQDLLSLVEAIASDHATDLIDYGRRIMDRGREPLIVLQNLANVYRDLLIAKTASDRSDLVAMTSDGWQRLVQLAQALAIPQILHGQQHLRSAEFQIRNSTQPRLWLEITLMGLLPSAAIAPMQSHQAAIAPPLNINRPPNAQRPNNPLPAATPPAIAAPPSVAPSVAPITPSAPVNSPSPTSAPAPIFNPETPSLSETPLYSGDDDLEDFAGIGYDLAQVWQNVLAIMQPSTKALLIHTMKAFVMGIEHQTVRICLAVERSNQIENHAKEKRNELESAFSRVLQRSVKVAFRCDPHAVATTTSPTPNPPAVNRAAIAPPPFNPNPPNPPNSQPSPPYPPQSPAPDPPNPPNPPVSNAVNNSQGHSPSPAFSPLSSEDMVIRNVAEFFNGQIVDLEDS